MKILHITCVRELSSGQRKQLTYEYNASRNMPFDWTVIVFHTKPVQDERFEVQLPKPFRGIFARYLYTWLYMLKNQRKYDLLINRHLLFDPFVLIFAPMINNRLTVHHAKEADELKLIKKGWIGFCASLMEHFTGKLNLMFTRGVIGVTQEIAEYKANIYPTRTFIYPNGIDLDTLKVLADKRIQNELHIAFVCGTFSAWHGLDLLLESIKNNADIIRKHNVKVHLIGKVMEDEENYINEHRDLMSSVVCHGILHGTDYINILSQCDLGLASFALDRKNMSEAATLKVREYLAYGLPVYANHIDTALPPAFEFYKIGSADIHQIIAYALHTKSTNRVLIRETSRIFISKEKILHNLFSSLRDAF